MILLALSRVLLLLESVCYHCDFMSDFHDFAVKIVVFRHTGSNMFSIYIHSDPSATRPPILQADLDALRWSNL